MAAIFMAGDYWRMQNGSEVFIAGVDLENPHGEDPYFPVHGFTVEGEQMVWTRSGASLSNGQASLTDLAYRCPDGKRTQVSRSDLTNHERATLILESLPDDERIEIMSIDGARPGYCSKAGADGGYCVVDCYGDLHPYGSAEALLSDWKVY